MAQYVYTMQGVTKIVPPKRAILENINLSFFPGAKIGVLGLNGAGKSSLLRIMAGVDTDIEGEARAQKDIKVGYLAQEPQLIDESTVRANVEEGVGEIMALLTEYNQISDRFAEPMDDDEMNRLLERQGDLSSEIDAADGWDIDRALDIAADALRLPDWDTPVSVLSGGERRRVALCKLLLAKPDMLLLDEPTNHLDAESVAWLERFLDEYPGTVVAVTHDRYFLDNVAGWILELDRGRGIPYEGNYSTWLETKEARLAQEAAQEKARQRSIKSELEWVRSNPKARQSKSRARLQRFDELVSQEQQVRQETSELFIPTGERLGEKVIELSSVHKGFGDQLLIEDLTANIPRGAIVGIIGGNGAGKSTLFKMLTGHETPDSGSIDIGPTVNMAYVEQSRDELTPEKTVWEEISNGDDTIRIGKHEIHSRAYAGRFNFKGTDQQKRVGDLSGGERNRVHLAKLLRSGANVLLLDEPTNDLDVETLRALEEALLTFAGSVLIISHDRWFLDRVATHMLAFEGDSHVEWFEGNFSDYETDRKRRLGDAQPTRMKYKPIHRK
ncbi:MAG: energy-dependent translational throttle protein EttA [Pseudomonadota bacterium]|nr:energy-dependent translational throttle protein EttA [Pseudomonadota bacterium]